MTSRAVVLLTGPSGCGKSRLGRDSRLPMLSLDDFYKNGDDPTAPRHPGLGIVDWDDPRSWDADAAVAALRTICEHGRAEVPVYDMAHDRAASTQTFDCGRSGVFIAEGIFAAELVARCRAYGMLADAIVVRRRAWKNFVRRLVRDLREGREESPVRWSGAAGCSCGASLRSSPARSRWARVRATPPRPARRYAARFGCTPPRHRLTDFCMITGRGSP